MRIAYRYSGKQFYLSPYTTEQEREMLLLELLGCEDRVNEALHILGIDDETIHSLTEKEKTAMLYKFREISIGDTIPIKYSCPKCKTPNESTIGINDLVQSSNITNDKITDAFTDINEDTINQYISVQVDDLDLDEYELLFNEVKSTCTKFEFNRKTTCIKCGNINIVDVEKDPVKYMSEDTIMSLYQSYNDLVFFGKYTKQDIDTLLPFERLILIGRLNKTREELNK